MPLCRLRRCFSFPAARNEHGQVWADQREVIEADARRAKSPPLRFQMCIDSVHALQKSGGYLTMW